MLNQKLLKTAFHKIQKRHQEAKEKEIGKRIFLLECELLSKKHENSRLSEELGEV